MKMVVFKNIFRLLTIGCGAIAAAEAFVVAPVGNTRKDGIGLSVAEGSAGGKHGYQFGDLTRHALEKVGESASTYKFGDITRWLNETAENVSKFTNKENYQFGDMSREVVRRLVSGEYSRDDLLLFLKIVATIGINLQPVTKTLPLKVLVELLNIAMEGNLPKSVGDRVVSSITTEIDGRMKKLVVGDRNKIVADFTHRALLKWMGKESYEFGDITKTYSEKKAAAQERNASNLSDEGLKLFSSKSEENLLEEWDKELLKDRQEEKGWDEMNDDESYRDWDQKFLSPSPGTTQEKS